MHEYERALTYLNNAYSFTDSKYFDPYMFDTTKVQILLQRIIDGESPEPIEDFKEAHRLLMKNLAEYLQLSRPLIIPFQGHRYRQRRPVADRFKATDPLWSGFEHGLSVPLPHVEFAGVDPCRVVRDAVEDGVGDGVAAETAVPFLGGQLGRERGAGVVVAQFHELKQEAPELLVGLVHEPFVDREQRVRGVFAHELGRTSRLEGRGRDLFREVGHPYVAGPVASPARGFHQRA